MQPWGSGSQRKRLLVLRLGVTTLALWCQAVLGTALPTEAKVTRADLGGDETALACETVGESLGLPRSQQLATYHLAPEPVSSSRPPVPVEWWRAPTLQRHLPWEPENATSFGKRVFRDTIQTLEMRPAWISLSPKPSDKCLYMRGTGRMEGWRDASASQGTPRGAGGHQEPAEAHAAGCPSEPPEAARRPSPEL